MKLLNLGCGRRTHPSWTNVDQYPHTPDVVVLDLRKALPFPSDTFDATYHSHVIEHLTRADALRLVRECHRVLRPGALLRVAAPDLEAVASAYLSALQDARAGLPRSGERYSWMILELLDQLVRTRTGGEMLPHVRGASDADRPFLRSRLGEELDGMVERGASAATGKSESGPGLRALRSLLSPRHWRNIVLRAIAGADYPALQLGRFRFSGEVHQWMYDEYSMGSLLLEAGFTRPLRVSATSSGIPGWGAYLLDADSNGRPHKPDSFYMEAQKPLRSVQP